MNVNTTYQQLLIQVWEDDGGSCSAAQAPDSSSSNSKKKTHQTMVVAPVYPALTAHQCDEQGWRFHDLARFAHTWWDRFNSEFELEIPKTALRLEWDLRRNCLGYFSPSHNEFGLINEIAIAIRPHVVDEESFCKALQSDDPKDRLLALQFLNIGEFLGSLLHEQLHLHQELCGKPGTGNYHNREYRKHAAKFGLIVTAEGYQGYEKSGRFQELLQRYGIEPPSPIPAGETPKKKNKGQGKSKNKKWICACQPQYGVRVAIADFYAQCLHCGQVYQRAKS